MPNKEKIFVSIIWGYQKYFYNFAKEEHYHMHALKVAEDMGYKVIVMLKGERGVIENDPLFSKRIPVIYYSNVFKYIFNIIKYSIQNAVFYVNSVEPQSLLVPFLAIKTVFMGHTHPIRQTWIKQKIFNFSMRFFTKIRLNNNEEKEFLLKEDLNKNKLEVIPLSVSLENYKIIDENKKRNNLVYFGNITEKKNLSTIIRACNIVSEKYPGIKLNLIGTEFNKIDHQLISKRLDVIKSGFRKPSEANILLNNYLISLNSSFDEGMCVSTYNAALSGCALCLPKIMSFTGVFKDMALFHSINDHTKLAENIIYYINNPDIARKHNNLCREMIKNNYDYKKISGEMKRLFTF